MLLCLNRIRNFLKSDPDTKLLEKSDPDPEQKGSDPQHWFIR
jgi:hypothetical protein